MYIKDIIENSKGKKFAIIIDEAHSSARNVRSRTACRLEEAEAAAFEAGRGQHAHGAGQHGRLIRDDIAKHVAAEQDVELVRVAHKLHGGVVDVDMIEFHIRIAPGHVPDDLAPENHADEPKIIPVIIENIPPKNNRNGKSKP